MTEISLLSDDLGHSIIHLAGHVRCVAADVEVGLLLQKRVDKLGVFAKPVLDVYPLG